MVTHLLSADEVLSCVEDRCVCLCGCFGLVGYGVGGLEHRLGVHHLLHQGQPGVQELTRTL